MSLFSRPVSGIFALRQCLTGLIRPHPQAAIDTACMRATVLVFRLRSSTPCRPSPLSCMPHMRTWRVRDFSLGYLGFAARRSSLSNVQIMATATPTPISNSRCLHPWEHLIRMGSVRQRLAPNTRCARLGISPASSYKRTRSMKAGEVRLQLKA